MPYMRNGKRDYKREYDKYHSREKQKDNRAKRNNARKRFEKAGKVRKGDGKDVDHKRALSKGGSNKSSNLRVQSKSENRSFRRTRKGRVK